VISWFILARLSQQAACCQSVVTPLNFPVLPPLLRQSRTRSRPTPFCLWDSREAALDEVAEWFRQHLRQPAASAAGIQNDTRALISAYCTASLWRRPCLPRPAGRERGDPPDPTRRGSGLIGCDTSLSCIHKYPWGMASLITPMREIPVGTAPGEANVVERMTFDWRLLRAWPGDPPPLFLGSCTDLVPTAVDTVRAGQHLPAELHVRRRHGASAVDDRAE
jgi:hypothetical protein